MSDFEKILTAIKENEWDGKSRLTEYLLNALGQIRSLTGDDRKALSDFAKEQTEMLLAQIPKQTDYKEKDLRCAYGDRLLALYPKLWPARNDVPEEEMSRADALHRLMEEARPIETELRRIFEQETVEDAYIDRLLSFARSASGEYEKGKLYAGLTEYKDRLPGLPDSAKAKLTDYLETELERYLRLPAPEEDALYAWEIASDIAKQFGSGKIRALLTETAKAGHGNISFYAAESLIGLGEAVPEESIAALAADPVYADLTYQLLKKNGMASRFPAAYSSPEYLAKSDLIHWLTYPTELGAVPDEIEFIGEVKYLFRKEIYYVFRFRSGSETLDEALRGKWLIGWSSENGGTFSNFDLLSDYEKPTASETLKNIKKRLIGR